MNDEDRRWWFKHLTACSKNNKERWERGFRSRFPLGQEKTNDPQD